MCSLDMKTRTLQKRRTRKDFTTEEINYLCSGVKKMGNHWNLILWSYPFQKGRTNVDLAKKYYRLQLQVILILFSTNHICGQLGFQLFPLNWLAKKTVRPSEFATRGIVLCVRSMPCTLSIRMVPEVIQVGLCLEGELSWENIREPLNLPVPPDRVQREQEFQLRTLN